MAWLEDEPIEAQSGTIELYVEHPETNVINVTTNKILTFLTINFLSIFLIIYSIIFIEFDIIKIYYLYLKLTSNFFWDFSYGY